MNERIEELGVIEMNTLIRKLADQAIAHANQTWNPDSEPERFVLIAMQKHAELIIQECLNNMQNCEGDLGFAIFKTKKRFGIK
jgi:hypothetical protein